MACRTSGHGQRKGDPTYNAVRLNLKRCSWYLKSAVGLVASGRVPRIPEREPDGYLD
jgi:hypothetical protein